MITCVNFAVCCIFVDMEVAYCLLFHLLCFPSLSILWISPRYEQDLRYFFKVLHMVPNAWCDLDYLFFLSDLCWSEGWVNPQVRVDQISWQYIYIYIYIYIYGKISLKIGRIALKPLFSSITSLIWGVNPNNQSIWLGHVRSWWILTIQKPSYEESDHFPRILALLCCSKSPLCCSKSPLCCSKTPLCCRKSPLCCSKKHVCKKKLFFPMKI